MIPAILAIFILALTLAWYTLMGTTVKKLFAKEKNYTKKNHTNLRTIFSYPL